MLIEQAMERAMTERVVAAVFVAAGADVQMTDPVTVREQVLAMLHEEPAEVDEARQEWLVTMGLR